MRQYFSIYMAFLLRGFIALIESLVSFGDIARSGGGTAAAVPPPFRPSEPALCGSCPL